MERRFKILFNGGALVVFEDILKFRPNSRHYKRLWRVTNQKIWAKA